MTNLKEILYFAVSKEHQRKGIGIKLLSLCINNETCDILYKVGAIMDNILIQNFCWRS